MVYVMVGSLVFGMLGVALATRNYYKLWQWARECQHARITLAYKGKVKLDAPLVEWMLWCRLLEKDKTSRGRTVYTYGGTQVAIIRKSYMARGPISEILLWALSKLPRKKVETDDGPMVRDVTRVTRNNRDTETEAENA